MSELPDMSEEASPAGRAKLLAAAGQPESCLTDAKLPAETPALARRPRRVAWIGAAAVVVMVTAVAVTVTSTDGSGPRIANAAAAEEALSTAAARTGDAALQPGQYLYIHNSQLQMDFGNGHSPVFDWVFLEATTYEVWAPADQTMTWEYRQSSSGAKTWLRGSPADVPAKRPDNIRDSDGDWKSDGGILWGGKVPKAAFNSPTPAYLAALPRDPKQLFERLRAESGGDEGFDLLLRISQGMDTGLVPADLRKALYRALAYLPDITSTEHVADQAGRAGQAFGVVADGLRLDVIIDPATGQYLGTREVLVDGRHGVAAGTVLANSSLTSKVVGATGSTS